MTIANAVERPKPIRLNIDIATTTNIAALERLLRGVGDAPYFEIYMNDNIGGCFAQPAYVNEKKPGNRSGGDFVCCGVFDTPYLRHRIAELYQSRNKKKDEPLR